MAVQDGSQEHLKADEAGLEPGGERLHRQAEIAFEVQTPECAEHVEKVDGARLPKGEEDNLETMHDWHLHTF